MENGKLHWTMRAVEWWNQNCDRVTIVATIFVAGMIVGSLIRYAQ